MDGLQNEAGRMAENETRSAKMIRVNATPARERGRQRKACGEAQRNPREKTPNTIPACEAGDRDGMNVYCSRNQRYQLIATGCRPLRGLDGLDRGEFLGFRCAPPQALSCRLRSRLKTGFAISLPSLLLFLLLLPLPPLPFAASQRPLFREAASETGLNFHHFTGSTGEFYMPEIMGAGAALFDYDSDGDLDIYLVQGAMLDEKKKPSESRFPPSKDWKPGNRLFRNELIPSGKLRFANVTEKAGVGHIGYGMGAATGDYDNDGDVDLYVTNFGSNVLYRNNSDGSFTDVTREAGVDDPRWSSSAAFVDYDRDGDLDLFVCNYIDFTVKGNKRCFTPTGEPDYCSPASYRPVPDRLFRNEGGGKFTDVTQTSGIGAAIGPSLGVTCADFNGDGLVDIYVANDGAANLLWINKGDGRFEETGLMSGAAYGVDGVARAGMGVTAGDFDDDGDEDLLVTNLTREGSTLYRNNGKGQFDDATIEFKLAQPSFLSTGFGAAWFDYDNDGWLDLFAANGAVTLLPALRGQPYPFHQRNQLFHNETGKGFREMTDSAGPALQLSEVSRAAAFGDIDNDGGVDILVTNNNGHARLLLNQTAARSHWLKVKLVGVKDNRDGVGAKVAVIRKNAKPLWRRVHTDGSYLAASDPRVHFGLGNEANVEAVGVIWPGGSKEIWTNVKVDSLNTLRHGAGKSWNQ
jgi:enediyne biosynthesis protein E4